MEKLAVLHLEVLSNWTHPTLGINQVHHNLMLDDDDELQWTINRNPHSLIEEMHLKMLSVNEGNFILASMCYT